MLRSQPRLGSSLLAVVVVMIGLFTAARSANGAVSVARPRPAAVPLSSFGPSHALHQSPKPELFVAYWDSDQVAYGVETFSRSGRSIDMPFGTFSQAVLFATDRKHDVFLLETGTGTINGYAEGSSTPFETVQIAEPAGVSAEELILDEQGDFWVAYRCGGSYCATPGNLTEYAPDGNVKQVFAGCLLSYDAVALDRHGNVFAAGLTKANAQTTRTKLVEYRHGGTTCQTILRNDVMAGWGGGLQVAHNDDLVLDFDAPQNEYLEILGGPTPGAWDTSRSAMAFGRLARWPLRRTTARSG